MPQNSDTALSDYASFPVSASQDRTPFLREKESHLHSEVSILYMPSSVFCIYGMNLH